MREAERGAVAFDRRRAGAQPLEGRRKVDVERFSGSRHAGTLSRRGDDAMRRITFYSGWALGSTLLALVAAPFDAGRAAEPIGQIKTAAGTVAIERDGASHPAAAGDRVEQSDVVTTGADGTVGITFQDNSMMSLGPSSTLALDKFQFDSTTHDGAFESSLRSGTLAAKSGYIVQQAPEAMKIRTPVAVLAVRGTEFVVRAEPAR
jgi:hypothetical protein